MDAAIVDLARQVEDLRARVGGTPGPELEATWAALQDSLEELRAAEEDLRQRNAELVAVRGALESEYQRYRDLFDFAPDGYLVTDTAGVVTECNRKAAHLLGVATHQAKGQPLADLLAERDRPALDDLARRLADSTTTISSELVLHPRAASPFAAVIDAAVARDAHGTPVGARWLVRDVSAQRRTEQDLRRTEGLLRAVVETAADGIVTIDESGSILSFNSAAEQMFGYAADEVLGRNVMVLMPEPMRGEHDGYLRRYLTTGERRIIGLGREVEGQRKDGSVFPLDLSISEIVHGDQRIFAGIVRDVSRRKLLEEELLHAQKLEAVGRLAGGIAHDFNNLLMGVLGCCRLAERALEEPGALDGRRAREQIDDIRQAVESGVGLTRQLLTFSRRQAVRPVAVSLNEAVTAAGRILPKLLGEDVRVTIALAPSGGYVMADAGQIDQILMNLAVNARDAMRGGGQLSIEVRDVDPHRGEALPATLLRVPHVLLAVSDTGVGMTTATKARLFEPFFTTKPPGEGTGLGLSMVYGVVSQFRGHIEVESEPGAGTTFRIWFPRTAALPPHDAPIPQPAQPVRGHGRVLVVEDERLVRLGVRSILGELGYEVLDADGPAQARQLAGEHIAELDLLLTDVVMPGTSGPELAAELLARRPGLAVVYMSAFSREVLLEQGRIDPRALTIEKPFDDAALADVVRQALARSTAGDPGA